jgi:hypothetical protein
MKRQKSTRKARATPKAPRSKKPTGKSACTNAVAMPILTLLVAFISN